MSGEKNGKKNMLMK